MIGFGNRFYMLKSFFVGQQWISMGEFLMTALQRIEILDQIEIYGLTFRELSNKISGGPDSFQHFFLRHSLVVLMLLLSIVICESKLRSLGFNDILLGRVIVRYSFIALYDVNLFR